MVESKFPEIFLQRVIVIVATAILAALLTTMAPTVFAGDIGHDLQMQLEKQRQEYQFPGATAAFVLPGGRAGQVAVGLSDVELELPMRETSRMPAGSIGKTFVAALALALVSEGTVSLDDKLSRWLGNEAWYGRLPNGSDIRIRNLLNHSSGVGNHLATEGFASEVRTLLAENPESVIEPGTLVGFILDQPPLFPAGEGYAYTDTGYILLQLALEKAGDFEWGEEVMRRFIYPLQLLHTSPADGVTEPGLAQGYVEAANPLGLPTTTLDRGVLRWNPKSEWAGGGFISTSGDLAQWMWSLFTGEAIPTEPVALMVSPENLNPSSTEHSYGLGIAVEQGKWGRVWRHRGIYPGYRSSASYYPDCNVSLALQINSDRVTAEALGATDSALADLLLEAHCRSGQNHQDSK